ncbi:MAG: hypothetical protein M3O36_06125 [Myxococcota bacterium]|nr:hypothetical protein [Myxococcota bacterium]
MADSTVGSGSGCSTANCPVVVLYMTSDARMPVGQQMAFKVKVFNQSVLTGALDLSTVTMRYWFLANGSKNLAFNCDYAMLGCANLTGTFTSMATPTANADTYLEVSFKSGSLNSLSDSGDIQIRLTDKSYSVNFDETKHWSFDATKMTTYAAWNHITLYKAGALLWGSEPQ